METKQEQQVPAVEYVLKRCREVTRNKSNPKSTALVLDQAISTIKQLKTEAKEKEGLANMWENFTNDALEVGNITPMRIRQFADKLIRQHGFDQKNQMVKWLQEMANLLSVYRSVN